MISFTPRWGFFSPFPRGTSSLSVTQEYLALRGGPRRFTRDFTCPMLLGIRRRSGQSHHSLSATGLSPSLVQDSAASPNVSGALLCAEQHDGPTTPDRVRFRLIPGRSPLLGESRLLSFPLATKMFQFARLPLSCLCIQQGDLEVALFGNLRIITCFQLPGAFRR